MVVWELGGGGSWRRIERKRVRDDEGHKETVGGDSLS